MSTGAVTALTARLARARAEYRAAVVTRQRVRSSVQAAHWAARLEALLSTIARLELELKTAQPTAEELKARLVVLERECREALRGARINPTIAGRTHWRARANVLEREIASLRTALRKAREEQPA